MHGHMKQIFLYNHNYECLLIFRATSKKTREARYVHLMCRFMLVLHVYNDSVCCSVLCHSVMSDSLQPHGLYPPGSSVHGDSPGTGSQRPWLGEAAPQPEGSSVCAQQAPARLGFPGADRKSVV